jgi:cysteinyl-tRNA synthetase
MNFTWDAVEGANTALSRLARVFFEELAGAKTHEDPDPLFMKDIHEALADDLDTPRAIARVWEMAKDGTIAPGVKRASLAEADSLLGLGLSGHKPVMKLSVLSENDLPEEIRTLVRQREKARTDKDFITSDAVRLQIEALGFEVTDTPEGQKINQKEG